MQPSHFRPACRGPIIFSAGPREAPKPGAAGGSRLAPPRSCAAASSPVPALIQLATAGCSATRLTGRLRGSRRRGATGSGCGPAARDDTRAPARPRRCSVGPRFCFGKPPGKRCDARGPSINRPIVAPPIPRTEGELPRNAVRDNKHGDDQRTDVKSPSACALISFGQKCDGCIFGRDGRI